MADSEEILGVLKDILEQQRQQTRYIRLWMSQDKDYHVQTLNAMDKE